MRDNATETVSGGPAGATAPGVPLLAEGTRIAGRYRIESVLGIGGSAVVYRAHDERLASRVALKLMRSDRITPASMTRFRREVSVARTIESEHVIRIHDIDESDLGDFITMELVDGESLRSRIERGPLPVDETLAIAKQILAGLSEFHRLHIVHRDVKPGNILIRADGRVKIADLGLARNLDGDEFRATATDAVVGTWEYLAPEQALGRPVDARTDLYAFGVLLYECLTGALPFASGSSIEGVIARLRERPRDIRAARPDVPRWLATVIARLLAKEPADRFGSADEVRRWLDRRRAPLPWKRIASVAATLLFIAAIAVGITSYVMRPRFAKLIPADDGSVAAIDGNGTLLWTNRAIRARDAAIVRQQGRPRWIVAIETGRTNRLSKDRRVLRFLSVDTGILEWTATLDNGAEGFPQFSDRFGLLQLVTADVDHDGNDLVIATFTHTYWPSFAVVYDPARRMSRLLFVGSGHHRVLGFADVNRDGRDDLLLGGIANKIGWYSAVAAIDIPPRPAAALGPAVASSPDTEPDSARPLLWYCLLPSAHSVGSLPAEIRPRERQIVIPFLNATTTLSFDGFVEPLPAELTIAERQERRQRVYANLRRVERLLSGGSAAEAERLAEGAAVDAQSIADPSLAEWASRVMMRAQARAGHVSAAETIAWSLMKGSGSAGDIAFDLAHELHLTGHLDEAVRWYREGLLQSRETDAGRMPYEFVEGSVLALSEKEDWAKAEQFCSTYLRMFPRQTIETSYLENYLWWRRGQRDFTLPPIGQTDGDLVHYWYLEFARASTPEQDLLPSIELEERRGTTVLGLVWSLKAEVLASRGDVGNALQLAREAVEWCEGRTSSDTAARAHLLLVRQRLAKIEAMSAGTSTHP